MKASVDNWWWHWWWYWIDNQMAPKDHLDGAKKTCDRTIICSHLGQQQQQHCYNSNNICANVHSMVCVLNNWHAIAHAIDTIPQQVQKWCHNVNRIPKCHVNRIPKWIFLLLLLSLSTSIGSNRWQSADLTLLCSTNQPHIIWQKQSYYSTIKHQSTTTFHGHSQQQQLPQTVVVFNWCCAYPVMFNWHCTSRRI